MQFLSSHKPTPVEVLIGNAKATIAHWREFGHEYGFDEDVERLARAVSALDPDWGSVFAPGEPRDLRPTEDQGMAPVKRQGWPPFMPGRFGIKTFTDHNGNEIRDVRLLHLMLAEALQERDAALAGTKRTLAQHATAIAAQAETDPYHMPYCIVIAGKRGRTFPIVSVCMGATPDIGTEDLRAIFNAIINHKMGQYAPSVHVEDPIHAHEVEGAEPSHARGGG